MKPSWEWTEADISALILNGVREDHSLDYKACGALLPSGKKNKQQVIEEISKDVSAFANSGGGTIIYGVIEDKNVPKSVDVGYDPVHDVTKEWLEQVINSSIKRRIDGVRINTVDLQAAAGRVIYVVSIPQSNQAPHMAADHRCYKRFEFSSVPMEEYELRDVSRRSESPDLHVDLKVQSAGTGTIQVHPRITNRSAEPVLYASIRLYAEDPLDPQGNAQWMLLDECIELMWNNRDRVRFRGVRQNWFVPMFQPILEGEYHDLYHINIGYSLANSQAIHRFNLGWEVRAPKAAPKLCGLKLTLDREVPRIEPHAFALARL